MKINGLIFLGAILAVLGAFHLLVAVALYVITFLDKSDMAMPTYQIIGLVRFWYLVAGLAALVIGGTMAYYGRQK